MKTSIVLWMMSLCTLLSAQPSGPSVRHGNVQFEQAANQLRIQQLSDKAVVNWQSFSIPAGHAVNIAQPGSHSALLNRVTGADPSRLMGQLTANGRVFLINPNGIVVGAGARIDAGAFIASTLDLSDTDFLAGGDMLFSGSSTAGVKNLGTITASNGDVILIGVEVSNQGSISSAGVTALAAGREVLLTPSGDQRIQILTSVEGERDALAVGAENSGIIEAVQAELKAAGGNVYDLAVNQAGIIRATGIENRNGRIFLTADRGAITLSGEISARNADGGGGEVFVGGGLQGGNPDVVNARSTWVSETGVVDVGASSAGASGGTAIIWADNITTFQGRILGQGGSQSGDGAFAEVSGKHVLNFLGTADLRAPAGKTGQLLLDPVSLRIQAGTDTNLNSLNQTPHSFEPNQRSVTSILSVTTLENQLALSDVKVDTSVVGPRAGEIPYGDPLPPTPVEYGDGTLVVDAPIQWSSGTHLNLNAGNNIEVNASIDGGSSGEITFGVGRVATGMSNAYFTVPNTTGELKVDAAATVTAGTVRIQPSVVTNPSESIIFEGAMGAVDFAGTLVTDLLQISYPTDAITQFGGILGAVSFSNPNNAIGTLRGDSSPIAGRLQGDFTVIDGSGGLTVEDGFVADFGAEIRIVTTGDLTLAPGAVISTGIRQNIMSGQDSDIYLAARGGNFINQAGLTGVNAAGSGRFLIYSSNPADNTPGGLTGDPVYNKTYDANDPSSLSQTGDRFVYSLAPTLTLTADPASKQQGDPNPAFGFTVSGLLAGDAAADVFSGAPNLSTAATTGSPAGDYDIDVAIGSVVLSDFDYLINLVAGVLTIDPGPIQNLLITANNAFKTFGDANPAFTATFSIPAAAADVSGLQFSVSALNTSSVGNYTITPFGASGAGYNISYAPGTLTINPRLLTIGAENVSKVYGDFLPALTPTFDNLASFHTAADLGPLTLTSAAGAQFADFDTYDITPSGAVNPNYTISYSNGTATVTQRPATLEAINDSREYGEANPILFATPFGFVNNDYNRANLTIGTSATPTSNVGPYAIVPTAYQDNNYIVTFVNGTLDITPAPLLLTAGNALRVYGDANPAFSFSGSGFKLGEDESVVQNPALSTPALPGSDVGPYAITIDSASALNYSLNFAPGTLTVDPRPILIQVASASRLYGNANPAFAPANANTNLLPALDPIEDVVAFSTPAGPTTFVGDYAITATLLNPNYALTTTPGTLTVNPRPLSIVVNNVRRDYGDPNPAFTFNEVGFNGIVNGDNVAAMLNLQTVAPSPAKTESGFYLIGRTGDLDARKYTLSVFVPGVLTVYPRPITLAVDDAQALVGAVADFRTAGDLSGLPYTVTASNLAAGDTLGGNVFPNLTFRTFNGTTNAEVVSANYRAQMAAPSPFSPDFIQGFALFNVAPPTEWVSHTTSYLAGFDPEGDRKRFLGILPDQGYLLQSRNYVVTAIVPTTVMNTDPNAVQITGSLQDLLNFDPPGVEIPNSMKLQDLQDISGITLTPSELGHLPKPVPLVVRSMNDYTSNIGVFFVDYPDVAVDMLTQYLAGMFAGGITDDAAALYKAIFGNSPFEPPLDETAIRAWLADLDSNVDKRALMGLALLEYLRGLQNLDPAGYTPGQKMLAEVIATKVGEKRSEFAGELLERKETYETYPVAANSLFAAREQLRQSEKEAAELALNYLNRVDHGLPEGEMAVLGNLVSSVLDGDNGSSIQFIEQWFALREGKDPSPMDTKLMNLLGKMRNDKTAYDESIAAFAEGKDHVDYAVFKGYSVYDISGNVPYGEILKETSFAGLEAKMARYQLLENQSVLISAGAGVAAGATLGGGGAAAGSLKVIGTAIFPYVAKAGTVGAGAGAKLGVGGAAVGIGAGFVTTWAAILIVQQTEQELIFNDLVEGGSTPLSFKQIDFSAQAEIVSQNVKPKELADQLFKGMLVESLEEMLLGF